MSIHKTAIIDQRAEIDPQARIGPYVVIEGKVTIAAGVKVMAHAYISGTTEIGPDCVVHPLAVLGHEPQDLSWEGKESSLRIGRGNIFREGCSVHRGSKPGSSTVIGDNNFIMGYSHIGHDCVFGNQVVLCNGALVAGYVQVGDKVFISGSAGIHQFVRVGTLVMIGGHAEVSKDIPPYLTMAGRSTVIGLNVVGLRRAGFGPEERARIKRAYKLLYHSGLNVKQALRAIEEEDLGPAVAGMVEFIKKSRRGICKHA